MNSIATMPCSATVELRDYYAKQDRASSFDDAVTEARACVQLLAEDGQCFAEALVEMDTNAKILFADALGLLLNGEREEAAVCAMDALIEFHKSAKFKAAHDASQIYSNCDAKVILEAM